MSPRLWGIAAVILIAAAAALPAAWSRAEAFAPGPGYRVPYVLSEDYWHYARYARATAAADRIAVIGDSVVWGEYVGPDETLPAHLNRLAGAAPFQNLGVNGIHPAALAGLIDRYARALRGRRVVLHYNPLWMSSPRHDLQTGEETRFNHPALVPQFHPAISCYKADLDERLGIVIGRWRPLHGWVKHVRITCFDREPLARWTLAHPYANPLAALTFDLPQPNPAPRHPGIPWFERGMKPQAFDWTAPERSLQWRQFQHAVRTLRRRGNDVFVVAGPFNEHMIDGAGRPAYAALKQAIAQWLDGEGLPHALPPPLPSDHYADASHPLAQGYEDLAKTLMQNAAFQGFLGRARVTCAAAAKE